MSETVGYTIRDRRGLQENEPCRVCGCNDTPLPHTLVYNQPTMKCIEYLRSEIIRLKTNERA